MLTTIKRVDQFTIKAGDIVECPVSDGYRTLYKRVKVSSVTRTQYWIKVRFEGNEVPPDTVGVNANDKVYWTVRE